MSFGQPKHLGLNKTKTSCRGREERALTPRYPYSGLGLSPRTLPASFHLILIKSPVIISSLQTRKLRPRAGEVT